MDDFHEVLAMCDLRDLGCVGSLFTWCNNREGDHIIFERLDCFLANSHWCELFPLGFVCHGQVIYLYHCLIWFNMRGTQQNRGGPKIFKFEFMWAKEDECFNIINDVWSSCTLEGSLGKIMHLIKKCGSHLSQ